MEPNNQDSQPNTGGVATQTPLPKTEPEQPLEEPVAQGPVPGLSTPTPPAAPSTQQAPAQKPTSKKSLMLLLVILAVLIIVIGIFLFK